MATPIGNLEDITLRALRTLRECDLVLAEDTRRTRALLAAHGIERAVERLDDHTVRERAERVLARLHAGEHLALLSDAGTPLVSDPGAPLLELAIDQGIEVQCLPGASAVHVALVLSGLFRGGYRFVGFLPRDGIDRRRALLALSLDPLPTVIFESPERVEATVEHLSAVCGEGRRATVHRELTKRFEESLRGTLGELKALVSQGLRGEVTMVVDGAAQSYVTDTTLAATAAPVEAMTELDAALDAASRAGMKPSDASREVARALGLARALVYKRAISRERR